MSRYRAVVFDLWDTLVVWPKEDGQTFHGRMAEHLGVEHERFTDAWTALYHKRATGALEPSVRAVCEQLEIEPDRVDGLIAVRVDFTREALVPRPGAVRVLDELRARGYRLGLISVCSEEVPRLWAETELADRIDVPVFSCSVGLAKPDPRIYELAARRLGVEPAECLFVDDQPDFVRGALQAGMDAVLLGGLDWDGPRIDRLEDVLTLETLQ